MRKDLLQNLKPDSVLILDGADRLTDKEYHSQIRDVTGHSFISSSGLKSLLNIDLCRWSGSVAEFGTAVHRWIEWKLGGPEYHVYGPLLKPDGTAVRKNANEYKAWKAELDKKHGDNDFIILTNSDYQDFKTLTQGFNKFLVGLKKQFSTVMVEPSFFVGSKIVKEREKDFPLLKDFMRHCLKDYGLKGRMDCVAIDGTTLHIYDWKTTSKNTLIDFAWQVKSLDYLLSLYFYGVVISLATGLEIGTINIVPLARGEGSVAACLRMTMDDIEKIIGFDNQFLFEKWIKRVRMAGKKMKETRDVGHSVIDFKDIEEIM